MRTLFLGIPQLTGTNLKEKNNIYTHLGEDFSSAIVALTGIMMKIIIGLVQQNVNDTVTEVLKKIISKNDWSPDLHVGFRFWRCSPKSPNSWAHSHFHIRLFLVFQENQIYFKLGTSKQVSRIDTNEIVEKISKSTGYQVFEEV